MPEDRNMERRNVLTVAQALEHEWFRLGFSHYHAGRWELDTVPADVQVMYEGGRAYAACGGTLDAPTETELVEMANDYMVDVWDFRRDVEKHRKEAKMLKKLILAGDVLVS